MDPILNTHKHVFLSYFHGDATRVSELKNQLRSAGEEVWWDQDILPGENWDLCIQQALKESYAVVICLSRKALSKVESGIYPEVRNAIEAYRRYKPGSIFLIPVRLDRCDIPSIRIDDSSSLHHIQYVDLFPRSKQALGFDLLVEAIRKSPYHP